MSCRRLKYLLPFFRRAEERDMREELDSLAAMAEPGELGNLTRAGENARAAWGWIWLERLAQDLAYAGRGLRKSPSFTLVALLTLALGIGANTIVFTLVNAVFLTPLHVGNHAQLRLLTWTSPQRAFGGAFLMQPMWDANILNRGEGMKYFSYPAYAQLRDHASSFAELACTRPGPGVNLPDGRTSGAQAVSGNFFGTLGVTAILGRTITPDDDQPGAPAVAVITYSLWQNTFGGDRAVLNQALKSGQTNLTIVGVLPPDFFGLDPAFRNGVIVPIQTSIGPGRSALNDPHNWRGCDAVLGIVRPGVKDERARAEGEALVRQAILADPPKESYDPPRMLIAKLDRGFDTLRKAATWPFRLLMAATGLILLIACANIAGLLLARGMSRQKEIATRLALGASRGRIVRQLLTESLVLASAGAGLGIAVAYAVSPLLPRLFQQFNSYQYNNIGVGFRPDVRVVAFSVGLALLTGLLFGLVPALRNTRVGLMTVVKNSASSSGRFRFLSGKTMLGVQVALSTLLLIGAGLFVRTLWNLRSVPMGYDPNGLLYFTVATSPQPGFVTDVMQQLESLPGVASATASMWPLFTSAPDTYLQVCEPGETPKNFDDRFADSDVVLTRFFETWRVPLLRGRDFLASEGPGRVIVNQAFVTRYLAAGSDPLEQTVHLGPNCVSSTIVGVVANSTDRPRITPRPFVYRRYAMPPPQITFAIRTFGEPEALIPVLRRIVAGLNTRVFDPVTTGVDYRERTMIQERFYTVLLSGFGGMALLIACIGIYGMLAYVVTRRTSEIGIRMSLGARGADVVRMIVRESLAPVIAGIAAGIAAAVALTKLVTSVLFGVSRGDPWAMAGAALLFLVTAAAAAALPARRASRIDPMRTLRYE